MHAFAFFGAVPQSVLYDNDRCLVAKIMPDGTRNRTQRFSAMLSHYVIRDRYGRPGKGNERGIVRHWSEDNGRAARSKVSSAIRVATLWCQCPAFQVGLRSTTISKSSASNDKQISCAAIKPASANGCRLHLAVMQSLPATPFEACDLRSGQVTSTSVVRYRGNDYSMPVAFGHREVWIKGFVDRVVIGCADEVIAQHGRFYDKDDISFDPVHYLRLIERKIMAFDQAAPLQDWDLPDAFSTLQRLLEARQGKTGKREYVQVLRLLEHYEQNVLHAAIKDALQMGAISFDAIKHLVLCRVERRQPRLDLDLYPFLPRTTVATTSTASYMSLLDGGGV